GECVDPGLLGRDLEQRAQVVDVGVDAAVRDETEQVNPPAALEGAAEHWVLEQGAVGDRAVDALEVLVQAAAGADRQVADLGVPHLAGRQADRLAGRVESRVWIRPPEPAEDRRVGQLDGIPRPRRGAAPAVEDDERYEWCGDAARHIAANDSRSSEAPPTSAPSMSRSAQSSSAFSGFTEPP